jgi:hypothetical protein
LGDLNLDPVTFWEYTPAEYGRKAEGYNRRIKEQHHQEELKWTHTRFIGALLININRGKDTPAMKPEELIPLSFDKKKEAPPVKLPMLERMKALEQKYKKK